MKIKKNDKSNNGLFTKNTLKQKPKKELSKKVDKNNKVAKKKTKELPKKLKTQKSNKKRDNLKPKKEDKDKNKKKKKTTKNKTENKNKKSKKNKPKDEELTSNGDVESQTTDVPASQAPGDVKNTRPWYKKVVVQKHEPIVYSCCGFCSLGAGSLLTSLIYMGLCIGFLVYRVGDFKVQTDKTVIWSGEDLFRDIWRLILIFNIGSASLSMLGALVLLVASCIWGQKESFKKMNMAVITWSIVTAFALLCNIGEALYITMIPDEYSTVTEDSYYNLNSVPLSSATIKENMTTAWALTGVHTVFYFYLLIVLVSYLRQLKYKGAPKVGNDPTSNDDLGYRGQSNFTKGSSVVGSARETNKKDYRSRDKRSNGSLTGDSFTSRSVDDVSLQSRGRTSMSSYAESSNGSRVEEDSSQFCETPLPRDIRISESPKTLPKRVFTQSAPKIEPSETASYVNWSIYDNQDLLDDVRSTTASSFYDMPEPDEEDNVYDETPDFDIDNKPFKPQPNTENLRDYNISKRANEVLQLSESVLNGVRQNKKLPPVPVTSAETSTGKNEEYQPLPRRRSFEPSRDQSKKKKEKEEKDTPKIHPDAASRFFKRLDESENAVPGHENPLEEMFRLFGGDLCKQHPENCNRYLKSYKDVRSKTSHITPLKEVEFGNNMTMPPMSFNPPQQQPVIQEIPLNSDPYSLNTSLYYSDQQPFTRHISLNMPLHPEPVYGFRPHSRETPMPSNTSWDPSYAPQLPMRSRESQNPSINHFNVREPSHRGQTPISRPQSREMPPMSRMSSRGQFPPSLRDYPMSSRTQSRVSSSQNRPSDFGRSLQYDYRQRPRDRHSPPLPPYRPYPSHAYPGSYPESIYCDDCSTCYGSYGYGDYGEYGDYGDYGSMYSYYPYPHGGNPPPKTPPPLYKRSPSVHSNTQPPDNRRPSNQSNDPTWFPLTQGNDDYSVYKPSENSYSTSRCASLPNLLDLFNRQFEKGVPVPPDITMPSPREARKFSRTTSFTSFGDTSNGERAASRPTSRFADAKERQNNYSGYHTGDLRSRTSHTVDKNNQPKNELQRSHSMSARSSEYTKPELPPRDPRWTEKRASMGNIPVGRPSMSRLTSSKSGFSNSSKETIDRYPDKHVMKRTETPQTKDRSVDDAKAIVPYRKYRSDISLQSNTTGPSYRKDEGRNLSNFEPDSFERTSSFRTGSSNQRGTKQVKFGSTPNLHKGF